MNIKPDFSPVTLHSSNLAAAFGMQTQYEVFALRVLARTLPENPVIVNIGAGTGTSSLAFAETRPDARIYTVDISTGSPFGGMQNEVNAFAGADLSDRLPIQVLGDSKEIGRSWDRGPADLIFIDGDHSYEGCQGDIDAWITHLMPHGILALHDYGRDVWPAVEQAVDAAVEGYGLNFIFWVDTLIAFRRGV